MSNFQEQLSILYWRHLLFPLCLFKSFARELRSIYGFDLSPISERQISRHRKLS